jgi:hypothetical protein
MRWELGQARPRRATLARIARACGVTVAQLADGQGAGWSSRDGYAEAARLLRALWRTPRRRALVLHRPRAQALEQSRPSVG